MDVPRAPGGEVMTREPDVYDELGKRLMRKAEHDQPPKPPLRKCLKRAQRKLGRLIDRGARKRALKRQAQRVEAKAWIASQRFPKWWRSDEEARRYLEAKP